VPGPNFGEARSGITKKSGIRVKAISKKTGNPEYEMGCRSRGAGARTQGTFKYRCESSENLSIAEIVGDLREAKLKNEYYARDIGRHNGSVIPLPLNIRNQGKDISNITSWDPRGS